MIASSSPDCPSLLGWSASQLVASYSFNPPPNPLPLACLSLSLSFR